MGSDWEMRKWGVMGRCLGMSDLDVLIRVYEGRDLGVLRKLTVESFG
jgi:hypothetical protein